MHIKVTMTRRSYIIILEYSEILLTFKGLFTSLSDHEYPQEENLLPTKQHE